MKFSYSSLSALLAHWRALKSAPQRSREEHERFEEIAALVAGLSPDEARALENDASDPAAARHRERAENKLRRALLERGFLAG